MSSYVGLWYPEDGAVLFIMLPYSGCFNLILVQDAGPGGLADPYFIAK